MKEDERDGKGRVGRGKERKGEGRERQGERKKKRKGKGKREMVPTFWYKLVVNLVTYFFGPPCM